MKIKYLDGKRFHAGLLAGGRAVIRSKNYLNKINVFPVADADTGTNLAMTMQAILDKSKIGRTLHETLSSVSDSALSGARGNSGIIFAQYLHSLSNELPKKGVISVKKFAEGAQNAVKHLYDSLMNPVEGTMLTVIREWAESIEEQSHKTTDFMHLLTDSLNVARKSLQETPKKLKVLADAGVVDAGASGFVDFLEGIVEFIHKGSLKGHAEVVIDDDLSDINEYHTEDPSEFRFCNETMIADCKYPLNELKKKISHFGDSLIVAGDQKKIHLHIHTNDPEGLFEVLHEVGSLSGIKVDDMHRQYEIAHERRYPIGIITESACDLPDDILDKYQISQLPLGINFGDVQYLDKQTIQADKFYHKLKATAIHPNSAQPNFALTKTLMEFVSRHYDDVISVNISDHLSGAYHTFSTAAKTIPKANIHLINTKQISGSQGLIALRVAESIESGMSVEQIIEKSSKWIKNTVLYTDVPTLKYMIRSGRVKKFQGAIGTLLNLKPLVTLDDRGKSILNGKSFTRAGNMNRTAKMVKTKLKTQKLWKYCIVHADNLKRAHQYEEILTTLTGQRPAYIMPISPVVGVHSGNGTVGVGVMYD